MADEFNPTELAQLQGAVTRFKNMVLSQECSTLITQFFVKFIADRAKAEHPYTKEEESRLSGVSLADARRCSLNAQLTADRE